MEKHIIIFGNITFHHFVEEELAIFKENTEQKALIHEIQAIFEFGTKEEVDKLIFDELYDSWVIPSEFDGEIVYEPNPMLDIKKMGKINLTNFDELRVLHPEASILFYISSLDESGREDNWGYTKDEEEIKNKWEEAKEDNYDMQLYKALIYDKGDDGLYVVHDEVLDTFIFDEV
jgi:hypothetical protein